MKLKKPFLLAYVKKYYNGFLYKKRQELGYTLDQMAKFLGIGKSTYSKIERMRYYPGNETAERISKILNKPKEEIFPAWLDNDLFVKRQERPRLIEIHKVSLNQPQYLSLPAETNIDDEVDRELTKKALLKIIDKLREEEKNILIEKYGLLDERPKALSEVAKMFNISKERVRQILWRAMRKLRTRHLRELKKLI